MNHTKNKRCDWNWVHASQAMLEYHDYRWCKPEHREQELFAMLVLEGMQAGLSWATILNKEANYRQAFDNFNPVLVAGYTQAKVEALLQNPGIIRNKLKICSVITNAQAFLRVQKEFGSFDTYIWGFTEGKVIDHHLKSMADMPAQDALSQKVSKDLKKRGFKFVGPVIIYSYLQAIGIINDHAEDCEYRGLGEAQNEV